MKIFGIKVDVKNNIKILGIKYENGLMEDEV